MKNRCLTLTTLIILICFALTTVLPVSALAGPGPGSGPGPGPNQFPGKNRGPAFKHVPPGGQKIRHRDKNYFFHSGHWYRHGHDGYFWARPPLGVVVYSLPVAAAAVLIGGLTYYMYDNVYYRRVPAGYQVVQVPGDTTPVVQTPPAIPASPAAFGTQVVVTAKVLNVRSGPGIKHGVLTQTYMGNILIVQGSAPDWYYVKLADNTYGWVMKTLVSVPRGGAQG